MERANLPGFGNGFEAAAANLLGFGAVLQHLEMYAAICRAIYLAFYRDAKDLALQGRVKPVQTLRSFYPTIPNRSKPAKVYPLSGFPPRVRAPELSDMALSAEMSSSRE